MNIFGIGPTELLIILLLMLIVAGPKRMMQWAYIMGEYTAKLRGMWQETSKVIRSELENSGLDPEVMDTLGQMANPRTRRSAVSSQVDKLVGDMKKPVEQSMQPLADALEDVNAATQLAPRKSPDPSEAAPAEAASDKSDSSGSYDAWTPN